ncbi:MAG: glycosyltransferase, partial [Bdellovibrionota bacterium]
FGISILEAMSRGLPVVTTDLDTGVSSLARGGNCGAVVPAGNSVALAEQIRKLLSDSYGAIDNAGRENLEYVRANHGRNILAERYLNFLRSHQLSDW